MFYKKEYYPEIEELVVCIVKKVLYHSVFVDLDEYKNREGVIHISEIAPGRIRNIRDYVREGKQIICKVIRVNEEKGHIDLSLRRVSPTARKKKDDEYKQEQKAEKILERLAVELKTDLKTVYEEFGYKLIEKFGSLINCFHALVQDETTAEELIPKKYIKPLFDSIKEKIKPKEIKIISTISLKSYAENGIEIIKDALKNITAVKEKHKDCGFRIVYIGAPNYRLAITATDYKTAEKAMQESLDCAMGYVKKHGGEAEFKREK